MNPDSNQPQSRYARMIVRATAILAAAVLAVTVVSAIRSGPNASAAGANAGPLQVLVPPGQPGAGQALTSGGSATDFALTPPAGAACTGDSATGGYRVQSYIVPASVNPGTLTFDANGPIPPGTGATLRLPLFSSTGTPFVDATTAVATTPGGGGLLTGLPSFSFAVFAPDGGSIVPAGTYNLGFACTLGAASATQQDRFWNVQLTFAINPADVPAGITWTVGTPPPPTTTTVPATTTTVSATTTTVVPVTTTSVPATTTTVVPVTTTTVVPVTTTAVPTTSTTVPVTTTTVVPVTTTTVPGTTTTTTTTTVPATTTTTTTPATTTTVKDNDDDEDDDEDDDDDAAEHENEHENDCRERRDERHGHQHGRGSCHNDDRGRRGHHRFSTMRVWRS